MKRGVRAKERRFSDKRIFKAGKKAERKMQRSMTPFETQTYRPYRDSIFKKRLTILLCLLAHRFLSAVAPMDV